jgi:hypothetical protein
MSNLSELTERMRKLESRSEFLFYVHALAQRACSSASNEPSPYHVTRYPLASRLLKSAVEAADSTTSGWDSQLSQGDLPKLTSEYVQALMAGTLLAMPFRKVPFHSRSIVENAAGSAAFTAEGESIAVSRLSLDTATVEQTTVAGIFFLTEEVTKAFTPASAAEINNSMVRVITRAVDLALMDPEYAAVSAKNPASILHGVSPLATPAGTEVGVTAAVLSMGQTLDDAGSDLRECELVMRPRTALYLSTLKTAGGALAYPGINDVGEARRPVLALTLCLATIDRLATELRAQRKQIDGAQLQKITLRQQTTQSRIDLVASLYGSITDALEKLEARTKSLNERLKKVEGPR